MPVLLRSHNRLLSTPLDPDTGHSVELQVHINLLGKAQGGNGGLGRSDGLAHLLSHLQQQGAGEEHEKHNGWRVMCLPGPTPPPRRPSCTLRNKMGTEEQEALGI